MGLSGRRRRRRKEEEDCYCNGRGCCYCNGRGCGSNQEEEEEEDGGLTIRWTLGASTLSA